MGASEGRAVGEALLEHPDHELYDEALPGEIASAERFLKVRLPPSYKAMLEVGSGGILADGDLLLGTKDPEGWGATLHQVARAMWDEGLPRELLPIVDGAHFVCLDLQACDEGGECAVVELDAESLEEKRRWPDFPAFAREALLG
ncbi:SMI1/KNR4 family protein [Vulgatibacter sp.]|uniref:SMI1/KNR4 family protein n=1 Tax=Vulgatibacter sp. TaxID=1971226 RepID=UPI003563B36E